MNPDGSENRLVADLLRQLPPAAKRHGVIVGAGFDDCAVVKPPKPGQRLLLKTDCVVEGIHFLPDTPPEQIGWKALCRAISDIAATGGKPRHALITLALSPQRPRDWALGVYAGIGRAADKFGVAVVGGETSSSPGPCFISIALTGVVRKDRCVTRGGGRVGDILLVTGSLGGSFPGGKHLNFRPRVEEGRWLARQRGVHAMMDLSDGLAADLPRLAATSGTGYRIDPATVPHTGGCSLAEALGDGEDYELLVAVHAAHADNLHSAWKRRFPDLPLTAIGRLAESSVNEGLSGALGYDHFKHGAQR